MALKVEENYVAGIPQTAVAGFAPRGLAWHWTAGATGRAGALGTIQHFINTRLTVNASYHILLFREGATTVAMWIVPVGRASHSMNPGAAFKPKTNSVREKARFAEVHRILARDTDPNADSISISFCGMPADLALAMKDPVFVADVRKLAQQLVGHPTIIDRPHFGHGWIQPITRYETDATPEGPDLLISKLYEAAVVPEPPKEDDVFKPSAIAVQTFTTVVGPASTFIRPDGTTGYFTTAEKVESIAEGTVAGKAYRLLDYGTAHEALLIPLSGLTSPGARTVGAYGQASVNSAKRAGRKEGADAVLEAAKTAAAPFGAT